ncbi:hypothetical protein ACLI4Z_19225 (plasmid) [Natrialbaceae archaeon A-arb3/5]
MSTYDTATQDGCEVTKTTDAWSGPHLEYDKYGEPTGAKYFRCRDCGREVHESIDRDHVSHRDGCRFGENGRESPTRHEPADFGGGETTGVQNL